MGETAEKRNLHQRLLEVQKAVTRLTKDGVSKAEGNFPYVSSNMVLTTIRAAMDKAGVILITDVIRYTVKTHTTQTGKDHYFTEMMVEYTWVNVDDPEERETFRFPGQGLDPGEKGIGKAATYSEKYGLLKFFHIPTDADDPDADNGAANGKAAPAQSPKAAGNERVCPDCGKPLKRRKAQKDGKEFLGCSGYPDCSYTRNIDEDESAQPATDSPAESPPPEAAAAQSEDIPQNPRELRVWMEMKLGIASNQHQTTLDSLAGKPVDISKLTIAHCASAWQKLLVVHEATPEGAEEAEEPPPEDNPFADPPELPEYSSDKPPTLAQLREFWADVRGLGKAKHLVIAEQAGVDLTAEVGPDQCWRLWEATWELIRVDGEGYPEWVGEEEAA